MKRSIWILLLCLGLAPPLFAQTQSPFMYTPFPSWAATATSQTSPVMPLNGPNSVYNYASGTVNVVGSSLSTATFAVYGSLDQGVTYNALVIQPCGTSGGSSTTATATGNGCYWVNLAGMDHLEFKTSGTFTATSVTFTLRANPNVNTVGGGSGGGSFTALTGDATSTSTGGTTTVTGINGTALSGLATGPLCNTTTTGVPSICTAIPAADIAVGALANGMTATTQSPGDNSTKLATTAYVAAASGGSSFPFTFLQEGQFVSTGTSSWTITFPRALQASGATAFILYAGNGSGLSCPSGWTQDFDEVGGTYAEVFLCQVASAGQTTAVITGTSWQPSAYFFELSGTRSLDQQTLGNNSSNIETIVPGAITPTAGAMMMEAVSYASASDTRSTPMSPNLNPGWNPFQVMVGMTTGGRFLGGFIYTGKATAVSTLGPIISIPNASFFSTSGVAYAIWSII